MRPPCFIPARRCRQGRRSSLVLLWFTIATPALPQDKVTFDDHITPIFRNSCFKCHNPDKTKADLDLTTYSAVLKGGGSGKAVVAGDPEGSKLFKAIVWEEEPYMPDKAPKLPEAEIELVRKWIAGGLLEKSTSQALAANKPKVALMAGGGSNGRPGGPLIQPVGWRLDPARRTSLTNVVTALASSPWSPIIAVGGQNQLLLYHSSTRDLAGVLPFPEGNPTCVQFSRDGRLLVVGWGHGARFGFADIYDLASGDRVTRVGNEYDTVLAADLNSDHTEVALGGPGKRLKVFSARDGRLLYDLKKHTDWVTAIQYSPDSVLLASGDRNGGLVVWEADSGQELYTLTGHQSAISSVSWRDDAEVVLSASEDGSIRLWEMREGRQAANWTAHKDGVLDARFTHDGRIVSCGRDKQITLWDAAGKKVRSWPAGGDLPVRATFSNDGSNILASSWQGKVGVWTAADGKAEGEISANPPTLAERLALADQEVRRREESAAQAQRAIGALEADVETIKAKLSSHERTSPAFQFIASHREAQAAHRKAIAEGTKTLEPIKAVAAKSAAQLAAAEAEAAKLQAALEKMEKFSEPYKQLAQQLETANRKVAATTSRTQETAKALSDKNAAIATAAAGLAARLSSAGQARDKASAQLEEIRKQSDSLDKKLAEARTVADQDNTRFAQQQASLTQSMTAFTAAEAEVAKAAAAIRTPDTNSPASQDLTNKLDVATKQLAQATTAHQESQKAFGEAKTAADKSAAALSVAEAEAARLKGELESGQKALAAAKTAVTDLETARTAAEETARKEIEVLRTADAQAISAYTAAKAETADLQVKLDKTEKFSEAYTAATQRLDQAAKQVAVARAPADRDRKEVADLQAALDKIALAATTADTEAAKVLATMAKGDPSYQHYQELERQLEAASHKMTEVRNAATNAWQEVDNAKAGVSRIQAAQAQTSLRIARENLASREEERDKQAATLAAAEADHTQALKKLSDAHAALAAQPAVIKALETRAQRASAQLNLARAALKQAQRASAAPTDGTKGLSLLIDKQNAVQAALSELDSARAAVGSARAQLTELGRQIKALSDAAGRSAVKLAAAKAEADDSSRELASAKAVVEKLAASSPIALLQPPSGGPNAVPAGK